MDTLRYECPAERDLPRVSEVSLDAGTETVSSSCDDAAEPMSTECGRRLVFRPLSRSRSSPKKDLRSAERPISKFQLSSASEEVEVRLYLSK